MADIFKALAHPVRRQILKDLRDGPLSAGDLADRFPVSKPTMSGHFVSLKEAGLILAERHGTTIRYRLNVGAAEEALALLMGLVGAESDDTNKEESQS